MSAPDARGGRRTAAVLTVGTELTCGLRQDTNAAEVAAALTGAGYHVAEILSAPDDEGLLAAAAARLADSYDVLVVTGGLGPTHDDVTREAVARALGVPLIEDRSLYDALEPVAARHADLMAASQVFRQALVIQGAEVLPATSGTAPGQVIRRGEGLVALLPGPPAEMRPMLAGVLARLGGSRPRVVTLPCAGIAESDAQVAVERALFGTAGVGLTVLARPGEVEVVLIDEGAGEGSLEQAADAAAGALGSACYAGRGRSLPEALLALTAERGVTLATAESCTGGLVAAEITGVPGASAVFLGGIVSYTDTVKASLLGVSPTTLTEHGAVSAEAAAEMAHGARRALGADFAVSVTGIAGPEGGTADKPVGLVFFGLAGPDGGSTHRYVFPGDRAGVRRRATVTALDLLRRRLEGLRREG